MEFAEITQNNNHSSTEPKQSCCNQFFSKYSTAIKIIAFVTYYVIGIIVFNRFQEMSVLHCIYFITVSITTVGYGYFTPQTEMMRLFMIPYEIVGVTLIMSFCNDFAKFTLVGCQDEIILKFHSFRGNNSVKPKLLRDGRVALSVIAVVFNIVIGTSFYW